MRFQSFKQERVLQEEQGWVWAPMGRLPRLASKAGVAVVGDTFCKEIRLSGEAPPKGWHDRSSSG